MDSSTRSRAAHLVIRVIAVLDMAFLYVAASPIDSWVIVVFRSRRLLFAVGDWWVLSTLALPVVLLLWVGIRAVRRMRASTSTGVRISVMCRALWIDAIFVAGALVSLCVGVALGAGAWI